MSSLTSALPSPSSSPLTFPVPVGGAPQPLDFAPSIVFALLYVCIATVTAYRVIRPESRNFVVLGTIPFAIERYDPHRRAMDFSIADH